MNFKYSLSIFSMLLLIVACDRPHGNKTRVTLTFPEQKMSAPNSSISKLRLSSQKKLFNTKFQKTSVVNTLGQGNIWGVETPTDLSQLSCYAVFVGGPTSDLSGEQCTNLSGNNIISFGFRQGLFAAGEKATFELTAGDKRTIYVIGFSRIEGNCDPMDLMFEGDYSQPILVGKTTINLKPGDQSVVVPISNSNLNQVDNLINSCSFQMGNPIGGIAGNGSDGDLIVTGGILNLATAKVTDSKSKNVGKILAPTSRVKSVTLIDSNLGTAAIEFDSAWNTKVTIGDVILLSVLAENNAGCGGGLKPGKQFETFVSGVSYSGNSAKVSVDFIDIGFTDVPAANYNSAANTSQTFCRVIGTRVPQFKNLTLNGAVLTSSELGSFDLLNHGAGGVAFKVSSILSVTGNSKIDAVGLGYKGGALNKSGQGVNGKATANDTLANANGGGSDSTFPSGGGHAGAIGSRSGGGYNGGLSQGEDFGGLGFDFSQSSLIDKIFMGGGGGASSTQLGADGGGIITIEISQLSLPALATFELNASGANAPTGSGGGGGGAGGAIRFYTENFAVSGKVKLIANGGLGAQPGGAGRIEFNEFSDPSSSSFAGSFFTQAHPGGSDSASGTVLVFPSKLGGIQSVSLNNHLRRMRVSQLMIPGSTGFFVQFVPSSNPTDYYELNVLNSALVDVGGACSSQLPSGFEFDLSGCSLAPGATFYAELSTYSSLGQSKGKHYFSFTTKSSSSQTIYDNLVLGHDTNKYLNSSSQLGPYLRLSPSLMYKPADTYIEAVVESNLNQFLSSQVMGISYFNTTLVFDGSQGENPIPSVDANYKLSMAVYDGAGTKTEPSAGLQIPVVVDVTPPPLTTVLSFTCATWNSNLAQFNTVALDDSTSVHHTLNLDFNLDGLVDNSSAALNFVAGVSSNPLQSGMSNVQNSSFLLKVDVEDNAKNQTPGNWTTFSSCSGLW